MNYYSTNGKAPQADLKKAVVKGLAEDRGLYMPERIEKLPKAFFDEMKNMSFQDIAYNVASNFFGEDVDADALQDIVFDTLSFDCPIVKVEDNIYALELFHGPTLAFKDVGARFMARLLQYFLRVAPSGAVGGSVNVLVATSGDTGSAVANGFLGVEGIHVYVLYPKGKVSPIQECQLHQCGPLPASGILLFQCGRTNPRNVQRSTFNVQRRSHVRSQWQLWQHLCRLVRS